LEHFPPLALEAKLHFIVLQVQIILRPLAAKVIEILNLTEANSIPTMEAWGWGERRVSATGKN
jgi:hypothetical protein